MAKRHSLYFKLRHASYFYKSHERYTQDLKKAIKKLKIPNDIINFENGQVTVTLTPLMKEREVTINKLQKIGLLNQKKKAHSKESKKIEENWFEDALESKNQQKIDQKLIKNLKEVLYSKKGMSKEEKEMLPLFKLLVSQREKEISERKKRTKELDEFIFGRKKSS